MRIGELAGLVGISTRAIRHYHRVGLLPEPARKANGYREYSLRDAVELARVRRLARAEPARQAIRFPDGDLEETDGVSPRPSMRTSPRPKPPRSAASST